MSCLNLLVSASSSRAEAPRLTRAHRFASARRAFRSPALPVPCFGLVNFSFALPRRGRLVTA